MSYKVRKKYLKLYFNWFLFLLALPTLLLILDFSYNNLLLLAVPFSFFIYFLYYRSLEIKVSDEGITKKYLFKTQFLKWEEINIAYWFKDSRFQLASQKGTTISIPIINGYSLPVEPFLENGNELLSFLKEKLSGKLVVKEINYSLYKTLKYSKRYFTIFLIISILYFIVFDQFGIYFGLILGLLAGYFAIYQWKRVLTNNYEINTRYFVIGALLYGVLFALGKKYIADNLLNYQLLETFIGFGAGYSLTFILLGRYLRKLAYNNNTTN